MRADTRSRCPDIGSARKSASPTSSRTCAHAALFCIGDSASASSCAAIRPADISPRRWSRPSGARSTATYPSDLVRNGLAISGVFDLEPLSQRRSTPTLRLDADRPRKATEPGLLAGSPAASLRCVGRRRRIVGIPPSEPACRRALGSRRRHDQERDSRRRQPFHRAAPLADPGSAHATLTPSLNALSKAPPRLDPSAGPSIGSAPIRALSSAVEQLTFNQ